MEHAHTREAIHRRLAQAPSQSYLRDWVFGGIDGTATTFAIVAGVVGAHLAPSVILILGGANLIADGFAMAAGNYLSTRSELEEFRHAEAVERRHIGSYPEGEREEVSEILQGLGIVGDLLDRAVTAVTADRDRWVRVMLRYEYGLPDSVRSRVARGRIDVFGFLALRYGSTGPVRGWPEERLSRGFRRQPP